MTSHETLALDQYTMTDLFALAVEYRLDPVAVLNGARNALKEPDGVGASGLADCHEGG